MKQVSEKMSAAVLWFYVRWISGSSCRGQGRKTWILITLLGEEGHLLNVT